MKFDLNRTDDLNASLTLVIEKSDYLPKLDENLKNYSNKLKMKGFRPGKTPKSVLTKMYGKGMLEETVSSLLNEKLFGYLEQEKIDIFGSPMLSPEADPVDFNPKSPEDYTFIFDLGLKPAFELQYRYDTPLNIKVATTDQEALDSDIVRYRRAFGTEESITEGAIEANDRVGIKLSRVNSDGSIEENTTETLIDLERSNGEAPAALIGKKVGDKMDVDLEKFLGYARPMLVKNTLGLETDPDPEKPLNYNIEVSTIARPQSSELTGEQLSRYLGSQVEDEAAFRRMLEDREMNANAQRTMDMRKMAVRHAITEANPFQIPADFLLRWVNSQREKKIETGSREAENLFREAKWSLLLNIISKDAGLEVTEEDIRKQVTRWIIENTNYTKTDIRKLMKELYANEYFMSTMKENALEEVVFAHIIPQYQFNETDATAEEFEHAFHDLHHHLFDHGDHSHD